MAQIKADEITQLLREQIQNYDSEVHVDEVGTIISLGDGIARIHGLEKVMAGELIEFPHGVAGLAMNLDESEVGAVLLGDYTELREREYPLLAPQPLADRLRLVAKLFPPNPGYEFAVRYRRRA